MKCAFLASKSSFKYKLEFHEWNYSHIERTKKPPEGGSVLPILCQKLAFTRPYSL